MILGQSSRKLKSSNRRFVTNNLTSEAGIGFDGGLDVVFVLIDKLRV